MKFFFYISLLALLISLASCGSYKISSSDEIFEMPEKFAEYPGGSSAMKKFLAENIIYPNEEMERGVQGKVFVQFIVEKDGSITEIEVLKGVSKLLDKETIRVISTMPKWTPAIHKKEYVRSHVRMPISFILV